MFGFFKISAVLVIVFLAYNMGRDGARVDQQRLLRAENTIKTLQQQMWQLHQRQQAANPACAGGAPCGVPAATK
jgi:hypothetical protein